MGTFLSSGKGCMSTISMQLKDRNGRHNAESAKPTICSKLLLAHNFSCGGGRQKTMHAKNECCENDRVLNFLQFFGVRGSILTILDTEAQKLKAFRIATFFAPKISGLRAGNRFSQQT